MQYRITKNQVTRKYTLDKLVSNKLVYVGTYTREKLILMGFKAF